MLAADSIRSHVAKAPASNALFSILIPTWNNLPYLEFCIQSILKNSRYAHEILIHVNEGIDGTLDWVKANEFTYTHSVENVGVCYALNSLAELSQTNYILYLNDDMYVGKDWDFYLYEEVKKRGDNLFYFSGTMVEYEDTGNKAVLSPYDFGRTVSDFNQKAFDEFVQQNTHANWFGSCWPPSLVHKQLWNDIGGYDTQYTPGFYSDPDFAMSLWHYGVRDFRGIGKSLVYHFKCKSTGRVVRNDGRKTFAQKWGVTSSFLYKHVLQMGRTATSQSLSYPKGISLWIAKIKAKLIVWGLK